MKLRLSESGPASEAPQTVVSLFDSMVSSHGNHTALAVKREGEWKTWTYKKYYVDCFTVAKAMVEVWGMEECGMWNGNDFWSYFQLGLEPHHGVCILGFNSPEWHISNIATIMAG